MITRINFKWLIKSQDITLILALFVLVTKNQEIRFAAIAYFIVHQLNILTKKHPDTPLTIPHLRYSTDIERTVSLPPEKERYEDSSITFGRRRQCRSGTPPVRTRIQTRPVLY